MSPHKYLKGTIKGVTAASAFCFYCVGHFYQFGDCSKPGISILDDCFQTWTITASAYKILYLDKFPILLLNKLYLKLCVFESFSNWLLLGNTVDHPTILKQVINPYSYDCPLRENFLDQLIGNTVILIIVIRNQNLSISNIIIDVGCSPQILPTRRHHIIFCQRNFDSPVGISLGIFRLLELGDVTLWNLPVFQISSIHRNQNILRTKSSKPINVHVCNIFSSNSIKPNKLTDAIIFFENGLSLSLRHSWVSVGVENRTFTSHHNSMAICFNRTPFINHNFIQVEQRQVKISCHLSGNLVAVGVVSLSTPSIESPILDIEFFI